MPTLGLGLLRDVRRPLVAHPFGADTAVWTREPSAALRLLARVLGLDGAEVLVPAYHHGWEVEALLAAGARPVFYRVGARWEVDLEDVERRVGPDTRAIVLSHVAGFPGPGSQLRALADRHGLALVEDCTQALFSADGDVPLGTTGDAAVFALRPSLPVPHGAVLVFNGRRAYQLPALVRPRRTGAWRAAMGALLARAEFRAPALGGALRRLLGGLVRPPAAGAPGEDSGVAPLVERIVRAHAPEHVVERRRRNFFHLLGALRAVAPQVVAELPPGVCPAFYPLWVEDKDEALARLRRAGVEALDTWRLFHPRCAGEAFPEAARLRRHVLALPCHQDLGPAHVAHVARAAIQAVSQDRRPRAHAAGS